MRLLLLSLLIAGASPHLFAVDRYVDGMLGDDTNDGLSLGTAWMTIQKAFNAAQPGDSVFIRGGGYPEHPVLHVSGLPGQRIWFGTYMNEGVYLECDPLLGNVAVTLEDQSHVTLQGLRILSLNTADATGVLVRCTPGGTVTDIHLRQVRVDVVGWTNSQNAPPGPNDRGFPFHVRGEGITAAQAITGLDLYGCVVNNCNTGHGACFELEGNISDAHFYACSSSDNSNVGYRLSGGHGVCATPALDRVRNSTLRQCFASLYDSPNGTDGGIVLDGVDSVLVYSCLIHDQGTGIAVDTRGGAVATGNRLIGNLIFLNHGPGLVIGATGVVAGTLVRNNNLVRNDVLGTGLGEVHIGDVDDLVLKNNIFMAAEQAVLLSRPDLGTSGLAVDHNDWYAANTDSADVLVNWGTGTLTGYDAFIAASGWEANGFYADPLLTGDSIGSMQVVVFPGSPCIDAGDPATVVIPEEDAGRVQGLRIDIGVYEFPLATGVPETTGSFDEPWPNPCHDVVHLPASALGGRFELLDVHGRSLLVIPLVRRPAVDLPMAATGLMLTRITTADGAVLTGRLVCY